MKFNLPKIIKYSGVVVLSLIIILTSLIFSLRFPAVQNFVKDKLIVYLENKIGTKVSLDKVYIGFPNRLMMENLYMQGQKEDTLFAVRSLEVGLDMYQLLNNTVDLTAVNIEGLRTNVVRDSSGNFNFDYIINAFATDEKEQKEESKPFIISLNKINLKDIGVTFIDEQIGNDVNVYFRKFDTKVKTFDLEKNNYAIGDIALDGLRLKLQQSLVKEVSNKVEQKTDSLSEQNPLKIALSKIKLSDFDVEYNDENTKTFAKAKFEELSTAIKHLDLQKQDYAIKNILLKNAEIQTDLFLGKQSNTANQTETTDDLPINVEIGNITLNNVKAKYNNTAEPRLAKGLDYNHLDFGKINFEMQNFKMQDNTFSGAIKQTQLQEKSGLNVAQLKTDFYYGNQKALLNNLLLKTPKTEIKNHLELNYKSIEQLTENLGSVALDANLVNSKIAFSDLLILSPELKSVDVFKNYPNAIINIDSRVTGIVDDLEIRRFSFSGLDETKILANGNIKRATNPKHLWFDFNIKQLETSSKTIHNLVPKNTVPENIQIPERISVKGTTKGSMQKVFADLQIASSLGNAIVKADVDMQTTNRERYNIYAKTQNLNIGKLIKNEDIGIINSEISAKGVGFNPEKMTANIQGKIQSAQYNNYNYKNINLNSQLNNGHISANINSADPNLILKLNASGKINTEQTSIKINGNITKVDVHRLGFYESALAVAGNINADFQNINPDELNGTLSLTNFVMADDKNTYPISDIEVLAENNVEKNLLSIKSQILDAEIVGKYQLTTIADELMKTANHYYQFT
ncbi:MAG: translocation/assembly module TamB, partial [Cruoricaptor ignavus]|nr:translocation/assembly module TamB [Cruoricaptor ignavus]